MFRGGDGDAESSDDEQAVQEALELPEGLLQLDTPGDENFTPTGAFCRALDREEEYDDVDHVATGRDDPDDRPASSTEVCPAGLCSCMLPPLSCCRGLWHSSAILR